MGKSISFSLKSRVISINRQSLYIFLFLCITVRLSYIESFRFGKWLYRVGLIISVIYIITEYARRAQEAKIGLAVIAMCLVQFIFAISTMLQSEFSWSNLVGNLYPITFILMFDLLIKKYPRRTIETSALFFEILIYFNCILQFVFPRGLYNISSDSSRTTYYLFGNHNHLGIFLIIAMMLGVLRFEMYNNKPKKIANVRLWCLFIVCLISAIRVWSVTTLIGFAIFIVVYLIQKLMRRPFPISIILAPIINIIVFYVLVVAQNVSWLNWLLVLFGRNATLTGRTYIWTAALASIRNHLLIGVGSAQGAVLEGLSTAHNRYLETLYVGGIIAFLLFIFYIFYCCVQINRQRRMIMTFGLVAYVWAILIMCQAEIYFLPVFYIGFIIIQNINNVIEQQIKV